jgi:hypothetical protein
LTVCNDDGMSVTTTMCATGCELPAATCKTIVPSNGLGSALGIASTAPDITLSSGTTIDTDTGAVTDDTGTAISLTSIIVQQPSTEDASDIRVFIGHSFTIGSTTVTGANALAFVSDGAIEIAGSLTAVASNFQAGPGAQTDSEAACAGFSALRSSGGGGNDTAGGSGGGIREGAQGGDAVSGFALIGGCEGGPINFGSAANPQVADGGAGGGAIQLVSSTSITLGGVINVGVGETSSPGATGGGAGGLVILESPVVSISATGGIAANGGGGGGCGNGGDATADVVPALAGTCPTDGSSYPGATGGTATAQPGDAAIVDESVIIPGQTFGGGGGSVGRARIATLTGSYGVMSSSLMSVALTTDTLVLQ